MERALQRKREREREREVVCERSGYREIDRKKRD